MFGPIEKDWLHYNSVDRFFCQSGQKILKNVVCVWTLSTTKFCSKADLTGSPQAGSLVLGLTFILMFSDNFLREKIYSI